MDVQLFGVYVADWSDYEINKSGWNHQDQKIKVNSFTFISTGLRLCCRTLCILVRGWVGATSSRKHLNGNIQVPGTWQARQHQCDGQGQNDGSLMVGVWVQET